MFCLNKLPIKRLSYSDSNSQFLTYKVIVVILIKLIFVYFVSFFDKISFDHLDQKLHYTYTHIIYFIKFIINIIV